MPLPTLVNTFGALEVGSFVAVFLFGVVTAQCYLYFIRFDDDHIALKTLVGFIWCLELVHTIAVLYEVYHLTIILADRPAVPNLKLPGFALVNIVGGIITMLVQVFYSHRIWNALSHPWRYIGPLCALGAIARCVASFYIGVVAMVAKSLVQFQAKLWTMVTAVLILGVIIDVTIAVSMIYFLIRQRQQALKKFVRLPYAAEKALITPALSLSHMIDRLITFSIRTGLMTSLTAITVLVLFLTMPDNLIYLAIYSFLGKLYSNTLLSALNVRRREERSSAASVLVVQSTFRS